MEGAGLRARTLLTDPASGVPPARCWRGPTASGWARCWARCSGARAARSATPLRSGARPSEMIRSTTCGACMPCLCAWHLQAELELGSQHCDDASWLRQPLHTSAADLQWTHGGRERPQAHEPCRIAQHAGQVFEVRSRLCVAPFRGESMGTHSRGTTVGALSHEQKRRLLADKTPPVR